MKAEATFNLKTQARGDIELFALRESGEEILLRKKNVILNGGADLMALALGGEKFVNGMYFAYDNFDPPFADTTPPPERTASFYQDVGAGQTRGVIRVPTISRPAYATTDGIYNGNQVTFTAITAGEPAVSSPFNDLLDGVSMFYGAGLGWIDPEGDITKDLLFSAVTFADLGGPTHYEKLAGAQIGLRWSVTFTAP
jgi:hypothetical protein